MNCCFFWTGIFKGAAGGVSHSLTPQNAIRRSSEFVPKSVNRTPYPLFHAAAVATWTPSGNSSSAPAAQITSVSASRHAKTCALEKPLNRWGTRGSFAIVPAALPRREMRLLFPLCIWVTVANGYARRRAQSAALKRFPASGAFARTTRGTGKRGSRAGERSSTRSFTRKQSDPLSPSLSPTLTHDDDFVRFSPVIAAGERGDCEDEGRV